MKNTTRYIVAVPAVVARMPLSTVAPWLRNSSPSGLGAWASAWWVSSRWARIYSPTGAISSPTRKGRRQPQLSSDAAGSTAYSVAPVSAPSSAEMPWLPSCQLTRQPRPLTPPASISIAVEAPISPPSEKPCSKRPATIISEPTIPADAYGGASAMHSVPSTIRPMVSVMAALRPRRSA
ncbi:hypothetical protein D9M72_555570 [compost metagenome]